MTNNKATSKDKQKLPKDIEVDVKNPRYDGATVEMVVKAMLRRPRESDQEGDGETPDEPDSGDAQSST